MAKADSRPRAAAAVDGRAPRPGREVLVRRRLHRSGDRARARPLGAGARTPRLPAADRLLRGAPDPADRAAHRVVAGADALEPTVDRGAARLVLARPLRDQPAEGAGAVPHVPAAAHDPEARDGQLRRPAPRDRQGPGDAAVPRRCHQRGAEPQRELRARGDGAVHRRAGPVHPGRRRRRVPGVHGLGRRRPRAAGARARGRVRHPAVAVRRSSPAATTPGSRHCSAGPAPSISTAHSTCCSTTRRPRRASRPSSTRSSSASRPTPRRAPGSETRSGPGSGRSCRWSLRSRTTPASRVHAARNARVRTPVEKLVGLLQAFPRAGWTSGASGAVRV